MSFWVERPRETIPSCPSYLEERVEFFIYTCVRNHSTYMPADDKTFNYVDPLNCPLPFCLVPSRIFDNFYSGLYHQNNDFPQSLRVTLLFFATRATRSLISFSIQNKIKIFSAIGINFHQISFKKAIPAISESGFDLK